jgi:ParB family chromosome partitioning protein
MAKSAKTSKNTQKKPQKASVTRKMSEKGLGRGLKALLGDAPALHALSGDLPEQSVSDADQAMQASTEAKSDHIIAIEKIEPNPWQPRRQFLTEELKELAASIGHHGIIQPLLVRPHPDKPDHFQLIAGERRWRAAQLAKKHDVPVVVRETTEQQAAEMALIENIQRQDLNIIEEAEGYQRLMSEFDYTQEALANVVGKSRSHLANTMRLLNLPNKIKDMLAMSQLTMGQVRPLIGHADALALAETIKARGLNARQAEQLAARDSNVKPAPAPENPDLKATEKQLAEQLGMDIKLAFDQSSESGRIMITCRSLDQFDDVIDRLIK